MDGRPDFDMDNSLTIVDDHGREYGMPFWVRKFGGKDMEQEIDLDKDIDELDHWSERARLIFKISERPKVDGYYDSRGNWIEYDMKDTTSAKESWES